MNPVLKGILGTVFTISEEEKSKQMQSVAPINDPVVASNYATNNQNFSHPLNDTMLGDTQKYKEHFLQVLKASNLPGNDYYELNISLDSLVSAIPDERTRFIAAYTPLSINGLTKEKVNSSAKSYLTALDQDYVQFSQTLESKRSKEVDGQKQQIENNNRKIQELTAQIQSLSSENESIMKNVTASESKIAVSKSGYESELKKIKEKITSDLNKINQYIQ